MLVFLTSGKFFLFLSPFFFPSSTDFSLRSSLMFGCVVGFVTGLWADRKYDAVQKENNGVAVPEYRLYGAMFFSPLLPVRCFPASLSSSLVAHHPLSLPLLQIGLFIFSFTQYAHVHWIAPIIALVPIMFVFRSIVLDASQPRADLPPS